MARKKYKMTEHDVRELVKYPVNEFTCCGSTMGFKEFKEHLSTVHKLIPEQFKGKKQMIAHMDGTQWFSSSYQWELETGLKFSQYVMMARAKDDPMRFKD